MARQEVYTTVIKLNSEEAKNRLKELEDRVARLKKAKQDAFSAGDSRLGASLAKDLKAAEREMKQFKNSTMSVKETLDNLSSASLGQLEKAARHLKGQMKAASDPSDFAKLDAQLSKVKEQMLALKGATRKADEEARRMTATVSNLKHASINDLNFTASKLRSLEAVKLRSLIDACFRFDTVAVMRLASSSALRVAPFSASICSLTLES